MRKQSRHVTVTATKFHSLKQATEGLTPDTRHLNTKRIKERNYEKGHSQFKLFKTGIFSGVKITNQSQVPEVAVKNIDAGKYQLTPRLLMG